MACTVCRLPFVPRRMNETTADHYPPEWLFSKAMSKYYESAIGIGSTVAGGVGDYYYSSDNIFTMNIRGLCISTRWELMDKTQVEWMMHPGCAKIFCKVFERENFNDVENVIDLCQVKEVLGPELTGDNYGRFPDVQYESAGGNIDLRPYWSRRPHVVFDFKALIADGKQWLFTRPDAFPRFPKVVDHAKRVQHLLPTISSSLEPGPGSDILTKQPLDIVQTLVSYLPASSYLNLTSTCKYLRFHAITSFQPLIRSLIIADFPWAFPTALEYDLIRKKSEVLDAVVSLDPEVCAPNADWMLYLTRLHSPKSNSMCLRRYIWDVCNEIKRVYLDKLPRSGFVSEVTPDENEGIETTTKARKDLEERIGTMHTTLRETKKNGDLKSSDIPAFMEKMGWWGNRQS